MNSRIRHLIVFGFIVFPTLLLPQSGKMDPRLNLLTLYPERARLTSEDQGVLRKSAAEPEAKVIITFQGDPEALRRAGVKLIAVSHQMAVATVPVSLLRAVAELPQVIFIESSQADRACLDESVSELGMITVREELGLTGKGVVIGVVDSGIDWTHPDFIRPDGTTRIKRILDLSQPGKVYGGKVYNEEQINSALKGFGTVSQVDLSGHGTHVAGIAAADGSEDNGFGAFAGVAPEASLVVVKAARDEEGSRFQTADQIIAMSFIDSVAAFFEMPYVINLSFGGHGGAHDGTSSVERFIDNMIGKGIPGKVVVTVAGNDREDRNHGRAKLGSGVTNQNITLSLPNYITNFGRNNDKIQLTAWYDGEDKIALTIITPLGRSYGPVAIGDTLYRRSQEGTIYAWNSFYNAGSGYLPGLNRFNGDREIFIELSDEESAYPPAAGTWTFKFSGASGTLDMWIVDATMLAELDQGAINVGKVSIPGTGRNVITSGAYISKMSWTDFDGSNLTWDVGGQYQRGQLATFSSPGPTRDGRIKPDIVAPGQIIASTLSRQALPSEPYSIFKSPNSQFPNGFVAQGGLDALQSGTSMAAPHVAGLVAILLQKYPRATAHQIKEMLTLSAKQDLRVGQAPNNDWGWGKIDARRLMQLEPGVEPPSDYQLKNVYPNPFTTSTTIEFELPILKSAQMTTVQIFNSLGQLVRNLLTENRNAGIHRVFWDGRDDWGFAVSHGIYFVVLDTGRHREVKKLAFLARQP